MNPMPRSLVIVFALLFPIVATRASELPETVRGL
ncbi:MAG: hypothetical protein QG656_2491, partial [Candidatus Hydrogenedentes bacterium]|nr:hypothetical protein [Candidatus Hydrogenedentota bacterium]